ncbi:App1 family protein [Agreia sp. COWG]|uniref:App1 family protein n=1 Tax=Agreia sp. COWG TaxID=2773266 RepID=UPI0019265D77|nr:phosphatase domain-containing protein [Agreia sp. COWG]
MHRAARIEDAVHEFRQKRAINEGQVPTVIPYTGYGSTTWVRVLCRVLLTKRPRSRASRKLGTRQESVRGWRSFTSVPYGKAEVTVHVGGAEHVVSADRGGVVDAVIEAALEPGWQNLSIAIRGGETVEARVFVLDPSTRFGVVSDIDDTVMVTALPRPLLAAWNTFVLDEHARVPTPGMAVLLERLTTENPGSPVVYLSTGAWNVAPTLTRFLSRNLYPSGPLLLTDWGPTHDRWFRSGREHKRGNLRRLAREFPDVRWLLIGDDGQHDEEIYSEFATDFPSSISAVAIRQLSTSEAVLAGKRSKDDINTQRTGATWVYSPDGAGLSTQLTQAGIL